VYGLNDLRIVVGVLVGKRPFFRASRPDGGSQPASCSMLTRGYFYCDKVDVAT